jgi:hypothetical protein
MVREVEGRVIACGHTYCLVVFYLYQLSCSAPFVFSVYTSNEGSRIHFPDKRTPCSRQYMGDDVEMSLYRRFPVSYNRPLSN